MHLSAFDVEPDNFPSVDVFIDFVRDSGNCIKWYYNPAFKISMYKLSTKEMKEGFRLLQTSGIDKLNTDYRTASTDQATSTTIYAGQRKIIIKDYGLKGAHPLPELYKNIYKL